MRDQPNQSNRLLPSILVFVPTNSPRFPPLIPPWSLALSFASPASIPSPTLSSTLQMPTPFTPPPPYTNPLIFTSCRCIPLSCLHSTPSTLVPPLLLAFHPSAPGSHPLLAFHPIRPWFPLSCLLSTPSTPGSPLLLAFHPIRPWFPLSCLLSTPSALVPSLLLAFHPIRPWFPLSCLLSTPSAPGSLSPACFPPHPPLVPPLLLDFHPIRPWFPSPACFPPHPPLVPLSCLLSTPSAPGSPSPACFPPHPPLLPPLLLAFHPIRPCFPLSCLLSTPSTPGSPSPACFPPHPPLVPPLLLAFHPIRPWFPLSCLLSTPSALVPPLLLAFHPIRPWFLLSCLLSTPSAPASPSPASFPPHPPWFPLSCLLSTPSAPGSLSPACFPPHPPLAPSLLLAFHPIRPWFPLSWLLSTPSAPGSPLSCLLSTPSTPGSPSPACFPPHPPLVHTALAIPPHDKMEWTSRGQFVKASPSPAKLLVDCDQPCREGIPVGWAVAATVAGVVKRYACQLRTSRKGSPCMADYHSSATTLPSLSPSLHRGLWRSQHRRCSLLPRPASRNNFSEQGEGERAREVATTAKRSGGERARRWLMDELGALGVDSGEEKWVRWRVGVGEVRSVRMMGRGKGRAQWRRVRGAAPRLSSFSPRCPCQAPHPSPSSARLALPPLLLLSTNSSAERPQRDDLGAAWARAVVETQAEQRWEHAKGWGGEGGFGGPWCRSAYNGGGGGMVGSSVECSHSISVVMGRHSLDSSGSGVMLQRMTGQLWQGIGKVWGEQGGDVEWDRVEEGVVTLRLALLLLLMLLALTTTGADPLRSATPTSSTSSAAASSTAATSATAAPTATAAPASASTAATNAPTPGTTPTATPTPSAASTTASTAPAGSSSAPAPLALASATSLARGRRCTDRLKTNKVSRSSRGNRGQERRGGAPLKDRGTRVTKRGSYSDYALLRC
ncbi:unnamed protein product [Closterium sp. NIES-64]|nr:unnamed protein product [Closterium sp. NIES-64]